IAPEHVTRAQHLSVVVDRLVVKKGIARRLQGSLQAALEAGEGQVVLSTADAGSDLIFAVRPACSACGAPFPPLEPALFSFNSATGACPTCRGLGVQSGLSSEQVFAGGRATLEGALGPLWHDFGHGDLRDRLQTFCRRHQVDPEQPVGDWPDQAVERLWHGEGRRFIGLARWLERISAKAEGEELAWLEERLDDAPCPSCDGARLRPESLAVELGGASIAAVGECAVVAATEWLNNLDFPATTAPVGEAIRVQINRRLNLLQELGLEYLQLPATEPPRRHPVERRVSTAAPRVRPVVGHHADALRTRRTQRRFARARRHPALRRAQNTARRRELRVPNRTRLGALARGRLAGRYGTGRGDRRRTGRGRGHAERGGGG
ncbi:MAG: hypothetical protein J4F35_21190, partial [Candidatus Latescibacteria bacterium]|nr:hypothetical protein [Candidatus Latescibacterota bacterium]